MTTNGMFAKTAHLQLVLSRKWQFLALLLSHELCKYILLVSKPYKINYLKDSFYILLAYFIVQ